MGRPTIMLAQKLEKTRATPTPTLAFISRILDGQPGITLKQIRWQDAAFATPAHAGVRQLEMEAELNPFDGNYRAAMTRIETLIAQVRSQPGVMDVVLARSPVNTASSAALSGNTRSGNTPQPALFALNVRYRETP